MRVHDIPYIGVFADLSAKYAHTGISNTDYTITTGKWQYNNVEIWQKTTVNKNKNHIKPHKSRTSIQYHIFMYEIRMINEIRDFKMDSESPLYIPE